MFITCCIYGTLPKLCSYTSYRTLHTSGIFLYPIKISFMPLAFLFHGCHAARMIPLLKWCVILIGLAVIVSCKRQYPASADASPRTHHIIDHANMLLYKGEH